MKLKSSLFIACAAVLLVAGGIFWSLSGSSGSKNSQKAVPPSIASIAQNASHEASSAAPGNSSGASSHSTQATARNSATSVATTRSGGTVATVANNTSTSRASIAGGNNGSSNSKLPDPISPPMHPMRPSGLAATASLVVNGVAHSVTPNQLGDFQRVYVQPGGTVDVTIHYPQGNAGQTVIAALQDGGAIDGKGMAEQLTLDAQGNASFNVQTTQQSGIYRVVLTNGSDHKVVNIWAGQETPLRTAAR